MSHTSTAVDPYDMQPHPLLLVISGPSGVGKDSLVTGIKERGVNFHFVVTATSRPPRSGEEEGIDYFFVSKAEFEAMIEQDALIEYAVVYGQYKGVPKQQVRDALDSGKDVVMRLDVQGATTVKRLIPGAVLLFLSAASEEELIDRLKRRKTEDDQQLQRRIETARAEMAQVDRFDYVVINRDGELDAAVDRALDIIHAEHARVHPRQVTL
jgi:guanylate kinase